MNDAISYDSPEEAGVFLLLRQNRLVEARNRCQAGCVRAPGDPRWWLALAAVSAGTGDLPAVVNGCHRVLELDPGHGGAQYNLAVALQRMGRLAEAEGAFRTFLASQPRHAMARAGLGAVLSALGRVNEAVDQYREAAALQAGNGEILGEYGDSLLAGGRPAEAVEVYREAAALRPRDAQLRFNLGAALDRLGRWTEAAGWYRAAVELNPDFAEAYNNLGHVCHESGDLQSAIEAFSTFIRLRPDAVHGCHNLAVVLEDMGRLEEAERNYREALSIDPESCEVPIKLGYLLLGDGRYDEAEEIFSDLLRRHPGDRRALAGKAAVMERRGEHEAAYSSLEPALADERPCVELVKVFAVVSRRLNRLGEAIRYVNDTLAREGLPTKAVCDLHFCLGELHEQAGEYAKAFAHYRSGNTAAPGTFDANAQDAYWEELISVFSPAALKSFVRSRVADERPVFIVGMPRSGTSLVEQILASHPQVFGAGEVRELGDIAAELGSLPGIRTPYPRGVQRIDQEIADRLSRRYLARISERAGAAMRVTDKMPHNFIFLGLVNLFFPGGRVIHVQRDPMDTCTSIYFQSFNPMHGYSRDLKDLGRYYLGYQRIMDHWKSVLELPVYTVRYEDIVKDTETTTRSIVEFCGLPWDDRCLTYYKNTRAVNTPSYDQVRRPIYGNSVGKWRRFEEQLEELKEVLSGDVKRSRS